MTLRIPAFAFFCVFAGAVGAWADCAPDRVDLRGPWGQATYTVEIADTAETRAQGLMFRETLDRRAGMLFIYDSPQPVAFWMRNTLIALDMVFIGADGVVQRVHVNAVPLDETVIQGERDTFAVLEVNGGQTAQLGIGPGTEIRHSAFGPKASWPCEND